MWQPRQLGQPDERLRVNRTFYMATLPSMFATVAANLARAGLLDREEPAASKERLVIEKPFGHDLASAERLSSDLMPFAHERQIEDRKTRKHGHRY